MKEKAGRECPAVKPPVRPAATGETPLSYHDPWKICKRDSVTVTEKPTNWRQLSFSFPRGNRKRKTWPVEAIIDPRPFDDDLSTI